MKRRRLFNVEIDSEHQGPTSKRSRAEANKHLKGSAITEWTKGGRVISVESQPAMTRRDVRQMTFGRARVGFTKRSIGARRHDRRYNNRVARAARRRNR